MGATQDADRPTIGVIGGGITGITTATVLQVGGVSTTLYVRQLPFGDVSDVARSPHFASLHAAASVLPHSVRSTRLADWTRTSRTIFRALASSANSGVRVQRHYELFEVPGIAAPTYVDGLDNFELLDRSQLEQPRVPRRAGAETLAGWRFDTYFCEAPTYLRHLYRLYEAVGGTVAYPEPSDVDTHLASYLRLRHPVYVNCTGAGTMRLLDPARFDSVEDAPDGGFFEPLVDSFEPRVVRGHYLRAHVPNRLLDERGRMLSYNYTPTPDVYGASDRQPADVYCYPRSDVWILGGSRQTQHRGTDRTTWVGENTPQGIESFPDVNGQMIGIPRPIFTLNHELIEHVTEGAVSLERLRRNRPEAFSAAIGYRFERSDPDESIRLACSRVHFGEAESAVIHNYGHGGAGYTLSWGCAAEVWRIVCRLMDDGWCEAWATDGSPPEEFRPTTATIRDLTARVRDP